MTKNKKINFINLTVKLILAFLFVVVIYRQLFIKNDAVLMWKELKIHLQSSQPLLLISAVLLMFVNWGLEALKWKILVSPFEKISFLRSIKTILLGITTGIITPAKLGDYFGRVLLLENKNNWQGVWATFVSSISQSLATIIFGYFGFIYILINVYNSEKYVFYTYFYLGLIFITILIYLYYKIELALKLLSGIGMKKLVKKIINNPDNTTGIKNPIPSSILSKILVLSFMRYLVFTFQYILLLGFFGISGNTLTLLAAVSTIFIIQSSIPLPPVIDILARGEIAILILSQFTDNKIMILSSAFSIWFINLLIPSLVGLILIIRINITKSFGYD